MPQFKFKGKFAKNLAAQHILVPHLDQYFSTEVSDFVFRLEPKEKDFAWHPSGDCTPPVTELYHMALDRQAGVGTSKVSKAFPVGHFWHQLLQKAVVDLGFATPDAIERRGKRTWGDLIVPDTSAWDEANRHVNIENMYGVMRPKPHPQPFHWATGQGDVAPLLMPGHGPMVVDFKTMSNRDYGRDNSPMPGWVAEKYEAQINIYMDFFDMQIAMILAVQKDTPHGFKEFLYERNQPLIDAVYEKWYFVSDCLDEGVCPSEKDNKDFALDGLFNGPMEKQ
jgi:hypothetical protein